MYFYGLLTVFSLFFSSCTGSNAPTDYNTKYFDSVEIVSPKASKVSVDNFAHLITLEYPSGTDISKVTVSLILSSGITMAEPLETSSVYDLTKDPSIKVKSGASVITFRFKINYVRAVFDPTTIGWERTETFGTLPAYLSVYKYTKTVDSKLVQAYLAVADMKSTAARFTVLGEKTGVQTPTQFYTSNTLPAIVMNGGYFWDGTSLGLIIRGGKTINPDQPMVWRTYNGASTVYYPTTGVFGLNTNGSFSTNWCYSPDANTIYTYTSPSPNKAGDAPQIFPSSTFPTQGTIWGPGEAIGAGPILIKDGVYKNLWEPEMFDASSGIGPTSNNPRSAIGYIPSGYLLFFVCEGRNMTANTPGLTLENVADLFMEAGCTEAINLDGGGSSCMLINGKETIKPSDGKQRSVTSAVVIY